MKNPDPIEIPAWCEWGAGSSHVLVLAPHGGAKTHQTTARVPLRGDKQHKINDLHTAELASHLADSLDASFIVNRGMDRNLLDLNRISQVRRKAPWFLEILSHLIEKTLRRHREVHLLVVHGWNVNQGRCDIGVGANLAAPPIDHTELTVSPAFLHDYLHPMLDLHEVGHRVTLGRRYPARHRNNLLQLFRHDGSRAKHLPPALGRSVAAGKCQAVQLELGIPMRWPGPRREDFVKRLTERFNEGPSLASPPAPPSKRTPPLAPNTAPLDSPGPQSIQAYDPRSGVAILASVDGFPGSDAVFGRVALFLPDGSVGLYTGEAHGITELAADGPSFHTAEGELRLDFDGSVLVTPNGDDYVDLERALDRSVLADTTIQLTHRASAGASCGLVSGRITVDGRAVDIETASFSAAREWGAWRRAERAQWSVRAAFDKQPAAIVRSRPSKHGEPGVESAKIILAADRYAPEELVVETAGHTMRVRPVSRMSIARPVGPRRRARVTFGPAEVELLETSERGFGLYEYARLIDR